MSVRKVSALLQWFVSGNTVFEHTFARIGRVMPFAGGSLLPDGTHLTLVGSDGGVRWRAELEGGVWGHPQRLDDHHAVCADLLESLQVIDEKGRTSASIVLPAPPNTDLLTDGRGAVFLGIGSLRCDAICAEAGGRIRWQQTVAQDNGLTHPLAFDQDNGLWVPTDSGLMLLDRDTGGVMAQFGVSNLWRCLSEALPWMGGALVVVERVSGHCFLMYVDKTRGVLDETPLPALRRARLFAAATGEVWLVGSTASAVDDLEGTEHVLVFTRDAQGHVTGRFTLPGDRTIDGTLGPDGELWLATYTGDEEERGALYRLTREGALLLQWSPRPAAGVAAPLLLNETTIHVPTSSGLACLRLEQTQEEAEILHNQVTKSRL